MPRQDKTWRGSRLRARGCDSRPFQTLPDLNVKLATSECVALPVTSGLRVSAQLFQQCLGCSQVVRVKPFGEPAIDVPEQLPRRLLLSLPVPEAGQARRGAQLPRLRLLRTGHSEGLVKALLRLLI